MIGMTCCLLPTLLRLSFILASCGAAAPFQVPISSSEPEVEEFSLLAWLDSKWSKSNKLQMEAGKIITWSEILSQAEVRGEYLFQSSDLMLSVFCGPKFYLPFYMIPLNRFLSSNLILLFFWRARRKISYGCKNCFKAEGARSSCKGKGTFQAGE